MTTSQWAVASAALVVVVTGCATAVKSADPVIRAEAKAIEFLQREVPAWSRENGCFSCHNNGDGARALYRAAAAGYELEPGVLRETTEWLEHPEGWDENKGDPGFSDKRLAAIQFASALRAAVAAGHSPGREQEQGKGKRQDPLKVAARRLVAEQAPDGSWPVDAMGTIGSPATYGTPLATYAAIEVLREAAGDEWRGAIERAASWLRKLEPDNSIAVTTLMLAGSTFHPRMDAAQLEDCLTWMESAQTTDGGWGPYVNSPAEPFDTALVLLALSKAPRTPEVTEMILQGRQFLAATQLSDGSWPPTTRPPGDTSYAQTVSTTGWIVLALLETRRIGVKSQHSTIEV